MAPVAIRAAVATDAARVVAIDALTQSTENSPAGPPGPDRDPFAHRPASDVLVAELDGEVVGYANLERPSPLASNAHVWELSGLAVDPAVQGRGVARALVEAVAVEVRARGGRRLRLRVLGHNDRARGLYERAGFVVEGVLREEFLLDSAYVDDVLMARRLD